MLHGFDEPHVWHGNTLTGAETYGGLFTGAPALYDVILMNRVGSGVAGPRRMNRKKLLDPEDVSELTSIPDTTLAQWRYRSRPIPCLQKIGDNGLVLVSCRRYDLGRL